MCTSHDSRPPIAPIEGAAMDTATEPLKGEDGAQFRAFLARPRQPTGAAVLILPDVRGLHPFFEELALRYAEVGTLALAIDYFGRTAGAGPRSEDFDHGPHVEQVRWENLQGDIRQAVEYLRKQEPKPRSIFTTGFCMGGRVSSMSATLGLGLAGVMPFYGWPVGPSRNGVPAPAENAGRIECDVLAIYGGADKGITKEARDAFDAALDKAGVRHETVVYDDAPHSFFDRKATDFADAATDAWEHVLAFIRRHTAGQPIAGSFERSGPRDAERAAAADAEQPSETDDAAADPRVAHWSGDD